MRTYKSCPKISRSSAVSHLCARACHLWDKADNLANDFEILAKWHCNVGYQMPTKDTVFDLGGHTNGFHTTTLVRAVLHKSLI